jgi:hypothetical protein
MFHPIDQPARLSSQVATEIPSEDGEGLLGVKRAGSAHVRGNDDMLHLPEGMVLEKGFLTENIQGSTGLFPFDGARRF